MLDEIQKIGSEAEERISSARTTAELEEIRVEYLGRKSRLTSVLRGIAELPDAEKAAAGKAANQVRAEIESHLSERETTLGEGEVAEAIAGGGIDISLPGAPAHPVGNLNLITLTRRRIEDLMIGLGYRVAEGPEIELDYYNFTALNHPEGHPARMVQDTFYVAPGSLARALDDEVLLRTHTSPVQVRAMESEPPPLFIVVPGKVYRRDSDATHSPMFHQVEGLAVAEGITLADLKGTLLELLRGLFGPDREIRMRPHFFPFTEPSVEFDVSCFACSEGVIEGGQRCSLCKGIGWIEVGGAGMVDPEVFGFVESNGYDPERIQGFAFGMGIERIAMLKHGIGDLRRIFEGDVRLIGQFG
ncbi:MAG: phenylalanine--tRNA ligase subunit alpha [bacterium]